MSGRPTRRELLALVGGVAGLGGCVNFGGGETATPGERLRNTVPESGASPTTPASSTDRARATDSTNQPTDGAASVVTVFAHFTSDAWRRHVNSELAPAFASSTEHRLEVARPPHPPAIEGTSVSFLESDRPELAYGRLRQAGSLLVEGSLRPLDDELEAVVEERGDVPHDHRLLVGDTAYLVPHGLLLEGTLNYRADVYEALGLSVPETWADLVENARRIDDAEGDFESVRGFAVPGGGDRKTATDLENWLRTADGGIFRWATEDESRAEVWLPDESVHAALDHMAALEQFSPNPAEIDYSRTASHWIQGDLGQCLYPNAFLAGLARENGAGDLAAATEVAPLPVRARDLDLVDRGIAEYYGAVAPTAADNHAGADRFLQFTYGSPRRHSATLHLDPAKYLPPYGDVIESPAYRNGTPFEGAGGHLLETNDRLLDDIAPQLAGERPRTVATLYTAEFPILQELVRGVLVEGTRTDEATATARRSLQNRLEEGRTLRD